MRQRYKRMLGGDDGEEEDDADDVTVVGGGCCIVCDQWKCNDGAQDAGDRIMMTQRLVDEKERVGGLA